MNVARIDRRFVRFTTSSLRRCSTVSGGAMSPRLPRVSRTTEIAIATLEQAKVVGTNDGRGGADRSRRRVRTGVGDAEATTAATRPRSNEEEIREKSTPPNPSPRKNTDARHRPVGRERGPHAPSAVIKSVPDSTAGARESSHQEPADRHAKEGTTKYTLSTTPAAEAKDGIDARE